jgi:hypothetical protein
METILSTLAFVVVIAGQFLAVIAVRAMHVKTSKSHQLATAPTDHRPLTVPANPSMQGATSH